VGIKQYGGGLYKYQDGGGAEPFLPWHGNYRRPTVIQDNRKINATTGKPINPNTDLKSGTYSTDVIDDIIKASKHYGLDPYELLAVGLQETNLGKTDENVGHVLHDPGQYQYLLSNPGKTNSRGQFNLNQNQIVNPWIQDMAAFYKSKMNEAERNNETDPLMKIQYYNGTRSIYPTTEQKYHKGTMNSFYGVPVPKEGISMRENPLYGKRITDLKNNVIMADPVLKKYIQDTYDRYIPQTKDRDVFTPFQRTLMPVDEFGGTMQMGGVMHLEGAKKRAVNTAAKGFNDYIINVTLSKTGGSSNGGWLNKYK
jgi:hypothetical protein